MQKKTSKTPKKREKSQPKAWEWSPVDLNQVLTVTQDRKILLGSEVITETELRNLQGEAKALKNMRIWLILQETVRQKAIEMGFVQAETWERTMSGKMMLHNLGILKSIVETLIKVPEAHAPLVAPRPSKHVPKSP